MFIDIHVHTAEFSSCSHIQLDEAITRAKQVGLDGLCITDHESNGALQHVNVIHTDDNFIVLVGMEILTYEGDILVFGLDEVPDSKMHAQELIDYVNQKGGATVSAHPFRNNGRGMTTSISTVKGLSGVEVFNGNTSLKNNLKAYDLAASLNLPLLGASDAHSTEQIGCYATRFMNPVRNIGDLVNQIRTGRVRPAQYNPCTRKYELADTLMP